MNGREDDKATKMAKVMTATANFITKFQLSQQQPLQTISSSYLAVYETLEIDVPWTC